MTFTINRDFARRYIFVGGLFLAMAGWFALDGYVKYPSMSARELYVSIEKSEPAEKTDLEAFKAQKIASQKGLMLALLAASAAVWFVFFRALAFKFSFDRESFTCGGRRYAYAEIESVDRDRWDRKGILVVKLARRKLKLDAWHHRGVREFESVIGDQTGK